MLHDVNDASWYHHINKRCFRYIKWESKWFDGLTFFITNESMIRELLHSKLLSFRICYKVIQCFIKPKVHHQWNGIIIYCPSQYLKVKIHRTIFRITAQFESSCECPYLVGLSHIVVELLDVCMTAYDLMIMFGPVSNRQQFWSENGFEFWSSASPTQSCMTHFNFRILHQCIKI